MSTFEKKFIHLSDLHFGKTDPSVIEVFEQFVKTSSEKIDGIFVTGDLTQRARPQQFRDAVGFFRRFPLMSVVAVPGNHDIPLYNPYLRFCAPYSRYNRFVLPTVPRTFADERVAIFGMFTANPWAATEGKVFEAEVQRAEEFFASHGHLGRIRIILSHHSMRKMSLSGRKSKLLVERLLKLRPQLFLCGHDHQTSVTHFEGDGQRIPVVAAGTGLSHRLRGTPNEFNLLVLSKDQIRIRRLSYSEIGFRAHDLTL
jgi:predicted phosphodiesterase